MNSHKRGTAILYSTSLCNLNCTYCYINKNSALYDIDKILEDSYLDENYYFDFIKRYFPSRGSLERLEIWGSETFLHMERVYTTLHKLINHYLFFNSFFASTNFAYSDWCERVYDLLAQFSKYPHRRFNIVLQLSLDGPEKFTDQTRGSGTTKNCLENFSRLIENIDEHLPNNVTLNLAFKPTLSIDTIYYLSDKKSIIEYYQFFEDLIYKVRMKGIPNLTVNHPIPNLGVPVPATRADGVYFAELCRLCREIEKENVSRHYFMYYTEITPFSTQVRPYSDSTYNYPCYNCGTGSSMVGFLPNNLISSCHNGFVDVLDEYQKRMKENPDMSIDKRVLHATNSKFTHTEDEYKDYERQISYYNCDPSYCRLGSLAGFIRVLGLSGEIDSRYADEKNAYKGALLFQSCTVNCIRDNYMVTGSTLLPPEGMIKLLLNGAVEYIMDEVCYND